MTIKQRWKSLLLLSITLMIGCKDTPITPGTIHEPLPLPVYFDYPAWHPDGSWIAVSHNDSLDTDGDGKRDRRFGGIWLVHAETGEKQPLISGYGIHTWSRDGRKLAMVRNAQIYTIEVASLEPALVNTSSLLQLTTEGRNFYPAWSPDGQWIVYDSDLNDPVGAHVIWKMRADGSDKKDISEHRVGEWRMPNWSPNGRHIVHQRYYAGVNAPEIVVMDTLGQNPLRLTFDDRGDSYPKYSPDGRKIAFYSQPRAGPAAAIWVMNSDGSNLRKVSPDYSWQFDWSPDGSKLVFLYWDFLQAHPGNGELWLINLDGTGLRQLTHFSTPIIVTAGKEGIIMNTE